MAIEQVHKWQSRGAYLAVNRHRSGSCVAVVQAYKRHIILYDIQKAYTWQSTDTYMASKRRIHGSHTWQLFVYTKGTELAIKRSRNW